MKLRMLGVAAGFFAALQFGPSLLGPIASWAYARTHSYLALYLIGWGVVSLICLGGAFFASKSRGITGARRAVATVLGAAASAGVFAAYSAWFISARPSREVLVWAYSLAGRLVINAGLAIAATCAMWIVAALMARGTVQTHLTSAST